MPLIQADKLNKIVEKIYKDIFANIGVKPTKRKGSQSELAKHSIDASVLDDIFKKNLNGKSLSDFDRRVVKTLVLLGDLPKTDPTWFHKSLEQLSIKHGDNISYEVNMGITPDDKVCSITINYIYK